MDITITTIGALIGLAVAIILIIKKIEPAYSMIAGAFVGGVIGGAGLEGTVSCMITGAQSIMPAILRIVTSGILAGVLIQSGAAVKIADQIIRIFGEKRALFSLALATMILTAVGVFGDVAVITVAPIAMVIGQRIGCSNYRTSCSSCTFDASTDLRHNGRSVDRSSGRSYCWFVLYEKAESFQRICYLWTWQNDASSNLTDWNRNDFWNCKDLPASDRYDYGSECNESSSIPFGSDFRNCNGRSNCLFLRRGDDRVSYFFGDNHTDRTGIIWSGYASCRNHCSGFPSTWIYFPCICRSNGNAD